MSNNEPLPVISQEEIATDLKEEIQESEKSVTEIVEKTSDIIEEPITETSLTDNVITEGEVINKEEQDIEFNQLMQVTEEELEQLEAEDNETGATDYTQLTREEIIVKLNDLLTSEKDIEKIKSSVANLKLIFHEKTKEELAQSIQITNNQDEEAEQEYRPLDDLEQRFNEVFNLYKEKKAKYDELLEDQKKDNLILRQEILEQLRVLIDSDEALKATYDKFKELQEKWKEIGPVPKSDTTQLWNSYNFLVARFFDKVKINRELKDLDSKKNLEAKLSLCEKAEELLMEKSIMKSFKKLQEYHQEWKEIGPVPENQREELWERFKVATEKINARRKDYYFQIKDQQDNNYSAKLALIEEASKLIENLPTTPKGWQVAGIQLNTLFSAWKSIGAAPKAQNEKVWNDFKNILDSFFNSKKDFFTKLKDQQYSNYNLRMDLCTRAEAVKDSTNWKEATQTLIELQKEWKNIGPGPKRLSDKVWKQFRNACDEFFKRKEAFFSDVNKHDGENLAKKTAIIEEINSIDISSENPHDAFEKLKHLQREWMDIGFVPIKEREDIKNAYRTSVNNKLDELKQFGVEVAKINFKNKIDNIKSSPNANKLFSKEKNSILSKIQAMQEEVNLWENNIGFLSHSKNAALLRAEFEKKIEKAKEDILQLKEQLKILDEQK